MGLLLRSIIFFLIEFLISGFFVFITQGSDPESAGWGGLYLFPVLVFMTFVLASKVLQGRQASVTGNLLLIFYTFLGVFSVPMFISLWDSIFSGI